MKNARGKNSRQWRKGAPVPDGAPRSPRNVLPAAAGDPIAAAFKQAVQHFQSGRLTEAEHGLHRIVQSRPEHADAWHLLGSIEFQQGRYTLAIEHLERAIALRPEVADCYFTLGNAYRRTEQLREAIAATAVQTGGIALAWSAATDSGSGVKSYYVYRNAQLIGTTTALSYSDLSGVGGTTYTYGVTAVDQVGNESGLSNTASITYGAKTSGGRSRKK